MFKFASKGCQGLLWMELEQRETGPLHPLQAAWQGHRHSAGAREVEGSAVKTIECFCTAPGTCTVPQEEHFRSYGKEKVLLENGA